MIPADVGNDRDFALNDLLLTDFLKLWPDRHTLQNYDFRLLTVCFAQHIQLLTDVGGTQPANRVFQAVSPNPYRVCSCCFGKHSVLGSQGCVQQATGGGLSSNPVDMDNSQKVLLLFIMDLFFHSPRCHHQNGKNKQRPKHRNTSGTVLFSIARKKGGTR